MNGSIEQMKHNESFHISLCENCPDTFFDWKITCLFYCAYHLLQALALHRKVIIGNRHTDILWNINPRNKNRTLQVKNDFFNSFDNIFEYSQVARYKGFTDFETFQALKKADYNHALIIYTYLKEYVVSQGVILK